MIEVSNEYLDSIDQDIVWRVTPKVIATWADAKFLDNLHIYTTSDKYKEFLKSKSVFWIDGDPNEFEDEKGKATVVDASSSTRKDSLVLGISDEQYSATLGLSGGCVYSANAPVPAGNFTLETLVRFDSLPWSAGTYWVAGQAASASSLSYGIQVSSDGSSLFFRGIMQNSDSQEFVVTSPTAISGITYHVALVKNGTTLSLIVNGEVTSTTISGAMRTGGKFTMGKIFDSNQQTIPNMTFQHAAIYNEAIDPEFATLRYQCAINAGVWGMRQEYFSPDQLVNGSGCETFLWGVLDAKHADGTYTTANGRHTAVLDNSDEQLLEYGWWGRRKSVSDGNLVGNEIVWMEFDPRSANYFSVKTAFHMAGILAFELKYRVGTTWTSVGDFTFTDGEWEKDIDLGATVENMNAAMLIVKQTSVGNDVSRLYLFAPVFKEDVSADVISIDTSEIKEQYDNNLPFGITQANTANIILDNTNLRYNKRNASSPIHEFVGPENKFELWLEFEGVLNTTLYGVGSYGDGTYGGAAEGATEEVSEDSGAGAGTIGAVGIGGEEIVLTTSSGSVGGGTVVRGVIETIKLGVFYSDDVTLSTSDMTASFSCRDFSKYFQEREIDAFLWSDATVSEVMSILAKFGGVCYKDTIIPQNLVEHIIGRSPLHYYPMHDDAPTVMTFINKDADDNIFPLACKTRTSRQGLMHNYVEIPNLASFALSMWIHKSSYGNQTGTIFKAANSDVSFELKNLTNLTLVIDGSTYKSNIDIASDDEWHYLEVVSSPARIIFINIDGATKFKTYHEIPNPTGQVLSTFQFGGSGSAYYFANILLRDSTVFSKQNHVRLLTGYEQDTIAMWRIDEWPNISNEVSFINPVPNPEFWLACGDTTRTDVDFLMYKSPIMSVNDIASGYCLSCTTTGQPITIPVDFGQEGVADDAEDYASIGVDGDCIWGVTPARFGGETTFIGFVKLDALGTQQTILHGAKNPNTRWFNLTDTWSSYDNDWVAESYADTVVRFSVLSDGKLSLQTVGGDVLTTTSAITAGEWYLVGIAVGDGAKIFINNTVAAETTSSAFDQLLGTAPYEFASFRGDGDLSGLISNFAFFARAFTEADMQQIYDAWKTPYLRKFKYLWAQDESIWSAMQRLTVPDFGMFYFNSDEKFVYEPEAIMRNGSEERYNVSQYTLSDDKHIISGSETLTLMVNNVEVKVYKTTSGSSTQQLWSPEDNEAMAVTYLPAGISKFDTEIKYKVIGAKSSEHILTPYFPQTGIIRIEDEFIKYEARRDGTFTKCERGYFGTTPVAHNAGEGVFEVKEYFLEFNNSPVLNAKYPFITLERIGEATIHEYTFTSKGAHLRISGKTTDYSPRYLLLNGEDAEEYQFYTSIAGSVISAVDGKENEKSSIAENKNYIRRYGLKSLIIDNPYITDVVLAKRIVDAAIEQYRNGASIIRLETIGLPHLELSDRVTISSLDAASITNKEFWIIEKNISYNGGITQSLTLKEVS